MLMTHRPIQLLTIVPDEWLTSLRDALADVQVNISTDHTWHSAQFTLSRSPDIEVVLIASVLTDATSKQVLNAVSNLPRPPRVIVAARYADSSLWYDVLEDGAYDLTVYPFRPEALIHVLISASRDCLRERDRMDEAAPGPIQR
jgi:DNA-binding NtrC family response regulator